MQTTPQQRHTNTAAHEASWLAIAGDEKARSIIELAPPEVRTVIDIGAGSGAVLAALDRMAFAEQYWACEPSSLFDEIPPIGRMVDVQNTTFDRAFDGKTFDLAVLSHVVEHLLTPAVLVAEALKRARHVIIEVPLDGNAAGNARAWIKTRLGTARLDNAAGHVQFFSRRSARQLVVYSGGQIEHERGYFPRAPYAAQADALYQRAVLQIARFEPLACAYHEHFAMLCSKRELGEWRHIYAKPV